MWSRANVSASSTPNALVTSAELSSDRIGGTDPAEPGIALPTYRLQKRSGSCDSRNVTTRHMRPVSFDGAPSNTAVAACATASGVTVLRSDDPSGLPMSVSSATSVCNTTR